MILLIQMAVIVLRLAFAWVLQSFLRANFLMKGKILYTNKCGFYFFLNTYVDSDVGYTLGTGLRISCHSLEK